MLVVVHVHADNVNLISTHLMDAVIVLSVLLGVGQMNFTLDVFVHHPHQVAAVRHQVHHLRLHLHRIILLLPHQAVTLHLLRLPVQVHHRALHQARLLLTAARAQALHLRQAVAKAAARAHRVPILRPQTLLFFC